MRKYLLLSILFLSGLFSSAADSLTLYSPSGKICVKLWMEKNLKWRVYENGISVLEPSEIGMTVKDKKSFSFQNRIVSHTVIKLSGFIISPVPEKRKKITDNYNLLSVLFSKPYKAEFRAYDDGVSYRLLTAFKDSITVENEIAEFNFSGSPDVYYPAIHKRDDADIFHTSYEEHFDRRQMNKIESAELAFNPVLVSPATGPKVGITESDLEDYPGMFLSGTNASSLKGTFAPYPLEEKMTGGDYPQMLVTRRADYIARTKGTRSFPWRVLIIADEDRQLPSNDIVYRLASPSRIGDASWVKPGKATDEWIINVNLFNVLTLAERRAV